MSGSKRLKRAIGYTGRQSGFSARRTAHKAVEQDVSKWVAWVGSTQASGELRTQAESYARGKAYKAMTER